MRTDDQPETHAPNSQADAGVPEYVPGQPSPEPLPTPEPHPEAALPTAPAADPLPTAPPADAVSAASAAPSALEADGFGSSPSRARARSVELQAGSFGDTSEDYSCGYHPERRAQGICKSCNRLVCSECSTKIDGINTCKPCLELKAKGPETREIPLLQQLTGLVATALLIGGVYLFVQLHVWLGF